jgi:hypothetical protein
VGVTVWEAVQTASVSARAAMERTRGLTAVMPHEALTGSVRVAEHTTWDG